VIWCSETRVGVPIRDFSSLAGNPDRSTEGNEENEVFLFVGFVCFRRQMRCQRAERKRAQPGVGVSFLVE